MSTKNKFLLILLIFIFLGGFKINLCSNSINNSLTASSINQRVNNTLIGPDLNSVNKKFNEIRDIPYNEKSMNCKHKSELFATYLNENGAKNVSIVTIVHNSGKYSHEFVEWNGHFYDLCNNQVLSYKQSKDTYLIKLERMGFTGITIESPYPNN
ncbi:MAG: hypothetical protein WCF28_01170 [Methanobacterium sp.]|uniref:hypothetical protein n=1 Tax=Methanobacterium sp. TaxID=2164 RepID=UPI003C7351E5